MTQVFKHIGALLAAGSAVLAFAPSAQAIANLSPGDFLTSGQVFTVSEDDPIAVNASPDGFDDAFNNTGDLLLFGANPGSSATSFINTFPGDSNSFAQTSSTFTIRSVDVDGRIAVGFNFAFSGDSGNALDAFVVQLISQDDGQITNVGEPTTAPNFGSGSAFIFLDNTDIDITGESEEFNLRITLSENGSDSASVAAGFNQITVTAVPFEFSPALGLLAVGGFFGGSSVLKRRKAANKVDLK